MNFLAVVSDMPVLNLPQIDLLWMGLCAFLVVFMQAGFLSLEAGLVRSINRINVAIKNLSDFICSTVSYFLVGFGLMFGGSIMGLFGGGAPLSLGGAESPGLLLFVMYQAAFCGTAATIISGAVAERMQFSAYLALAIFTSTLTYPIIGHWIWGGTVLGEPGWLKALGFIDFAGAAVVHVVGGAAALAAVIVLGPRSGRFGEKRRDLRSNDPTFAALGVMIIWLGWFGFNGGSTLAFSRDVPRVLINTLLGGGAGGIAALLVGPGLDGGKFTVMPLLSGVLAGLVAITGGAVFFTPLEALCIGFIGGVIAIAGISLLERWRIDDVVTAIPVHLFAGIWGVLAVAVFGGGDGLAAWANRSRVAFLWVQFLGVAVAGLAAFGATFGFLQVLKRTTGIRVDAEAERVGLNISEHDAGTATNDLIEAMHDQLATGNFNQAIVAETGTEVGQITTMYNHVVGQVASLSEDERRLRQSIQTTNERLRVQRDISRALSRSGSAVEALTETLPVLLRSGEFIGIRILQVSPVDDASAAEVQHQLLASCWLHDGRLWQNPEQSAPASATDRLGPWQFSDEFAEPVSITQRRVSKRDLSWSASGQGETDGPVEGSGGPLVIKLALAEPIFVGDRVSAVAIFYSMHECLDAFAEGGLVDGLLSELAYLLERDVREAALKSALKAAEAAAQAKADFLAMMSHEIRTPMNGVFGMSQLLAQTGLDQEQHSYVATIRESADALLVVINDILDFSKFDSANFHLEVRDFLLEDVVAGAIELLMPKASNKGLELMFSLDPRLPAAVAGDAIRLRQILINILGNAVKFTSEGTVFVKLMPADCDSPGRLAIHCTIEDSGIGIPADIVPNLFDSFTQADSSTTREYGGTGLGLAICRKLVTAMQGKIWVESNVGEGSTFHFTARFAPASVQPLTPAGGDASEMIGRRVLVVDDNETNLEILEKQLVLWGMEPVVLSDPMKLEGVLAHESAFDLILLDFHMPGRDGVEVASIVRQDPVHSATQMVLLSSVEPELLRPRASEIDRLFHAHLTKPPRSKTLFKTIHDALVVVPVTNSVPLLAPSLAEQPPKLSPTFGRDHPLRILLVDDNAINRKLASLMLKKLGYGPVLVTSGKEALAAVSEQAFDLVLMDVEMPDMDGLETTQAIRAKGGRCAELNIIALTAAALLEDRERCLAAGMNDYITKPLSQKELLRVLANAHAIDHAETPPASEVSPLDKPALGGNGSSAVTSIGSDELTLITDGDPTVEHELLSTFLDDMARTEHILSANLKAGACKPIGLAMHSVKFPMLIFGSKELSDLSGMIETQARAGDLASICATESQFLERSALFRRALNLRLAELSELMT